LRIAVDLVGGETPPLLLFEAVLKAATCFSFVHFVILITPPLKKQLLSLDFWQKNSSFFCERFQFQVVDSIISMQEAPLQAVKQKKGSSMMQGIYSLKEQEVDAFVTPGNTGALIAGSALLLPRIAPVKRPALLATLPTKNGIASIIDVGGTTNCRALHLLQLMQMGLAFQQIKKPGLITRVGLLNIGKELQKGTAEIRKVYRYFQTHLAKFASVNFVGNIEGDRLFAGEVDLLITDGFSGNVLLKAAEGVFSLVQQTLSQNLEFFTPCQKSKLLCSLAKRFDHEESPGAIVCGVKGVIVKCHGAAKAEALFHSIATAIELVEQQFIAKMEHFVSFYQA